MKRYLLPLSPVFIAILFSGWYFHDYVFSDNHSYTGEHAIIFLFEIIVLSILTAIILKDSTHNKIEKSVFFFALGCAFLISYASAGFADHYLSIRNAAATKVYDAKMAAAKASTAQQILSICNEKFKNPVKVLRSNEGYDLQVENADVILFYPYYIAVVDAGADISYATLDSERNAFQNFVTTSLIGKEVVIRCPSYNDLLLVDSLSTNTIPVLIYFNGKILNTSPYLLDGSPYNDGQNNPVQEIKNNYPITLKTN